MVATVIGWISFFCMALLSFGLGGYSAETAGIVSPHEFSLVRQNFTRKQFAAITKQYTSYYLFFGEKTDTLYTNGGLAVGMCFPDSYPNTTHRILSHFVQSSVRVEYTNRVLTREQISWKKSDEKSKKTIPSTDSTSNSTDASLKSTQSPSGVTDTAQNTSSPSEPAEPDQDKDKNNKIHNHLIFVMLLPHHPYSQELRKIITTVTPMFPQATIVLGNAYEFKDMTAKYYVTSFPKILYFRSGIYLEAFEGAYTAQDVAGQFADWTYSLPQAVPVPFSRTELARRTARLSRQLDIYAPGGQMRYGLALQPLPLTVQYTLLNFTVPLPRWAQQYVPWLQVKNSIDGTLSDRKKDVPHFPPVNGVPAADAIGVHESEYMESVAGIDGSISEAGSAGSDSPLLAPLAVPTTDAAQSGVADSAGSTLHTAAAVIPVHLSITVPMPNVEPFLGSLDNYAVWDTRMFLLAGLYVVTRVLYLLRKWVSGAH